mgnify:CR=1 FL=1
MTFDLGLIKTDNLLKSISGQFILTLFLSGKVGVGDTGRRYELPIKKESLENFTLSAVDYVLTPSYMSLSTLELTISGVGELQSLAKMRKE